MSNAAKLGQWIFDRVPKNDELEVIFQRKDGYKTLGGRFLVWSHYGGVRISMFNRPPKNEEKGGGWYPGYWDDSTVQAWMPLPNPPLVIPDEK